MGVLSAIEHENRSKLMPSPPRTHPALTEIHECLGPFLTVFKIPVTSCPTTSRCVVIVL